MCVCNFFFKLSWSSQVQLLFLGGLVLELGLGVSASFGIKACTNLEALLLQVGDGITRHQVLSAVWNRLPGDGGVSLCLLRHASLVVREAEGQAGQGSLADADQGHSLAVRACHRHVDQGLAEVGALGVSASVGAQILELCVDVLALLAQTVLAACTDQLHVVIVAEVATGAGSGCKGAGVIKKITK